MNTRTKRTGLVAVLVSVFAFASGCDYSNGNGGPGIHLAVDPEDMGPACAIYTGCLRQHYVGACAMSLDMGGHLDLTEMTATLAEESFLTDWPVMISLAQNIDCVLAAGSNCDEFLACMNQGKTVRNCEYLEDHVQSRYCSDENTLSACVEAGDEWYPPDITAEISVRCDDLGLVCMESISDGEVWAACMKKIEKTVSGVEVECSGTVASIFFGKGLLKYDCAFEGCVCEPGTYIDMDAAHEQGFCKCPICDEAYERRCEGDYLMYCSSGDEVSIDCNKVGLVCRETVDEHGTHHFCSYRTCEPMQMVEECTDGVIDYCRSDGMTTISCTELGFSGCEIGAGCLE